MGPAQQGLEPYDPPGAQADLRLIDHGQFVLPEGAPQVCVQRGARSANGDGYWIIELEAVAAAFLGSVQRRVGMTEQRVAFPPVDRMNAHANACRNHQLLLAELNGHADRIEKLLDRWRRSLAAKASPAG